MRDCNVPTVGSYKPVLHCGRSDRHQNTRPCQTDFGRFTQGTSGNRAAIAKSARRIAHNDREGLHKTWILVPVVQNNNVGPATYGRFCGSNAVFGDPNWAERWSKILMFRMFSKLLSRFGTVKQRQLSVFAVV